MTDVRLTANGRALMALAFVLAAAALVAAIALPIVHVRQQAERRTLRTGGIATSATIVAVTVTRGEQPRHDVTYRYEVEGRAYERTARMSQRDRQPLTVGSRLPIFYLDAEPARSWLPDREPDVLPLWIVPLVTCALTMLSSALFWRIRRDRVLLAEGRLVQGRVIETKKVKHQHHHAHRVRYTFTTLNGAVVTGSTELRRAPGETISVLYHRDNPRRNAIYPLTLVARKVPR